MVEFQKKYVIKSDETLQISISLGVLSNEYHRNHLHHCCDVLMGTIASQVTRKHQSSASLAFVREFTGTGEFPAHMASNAENLWRHHERQYLKSGSYHTPCQDGNTNWVGCATHRFFRRKVHNCNLALFKYLLSPVFIRVNNSNFSPWLHFLCKLIGREIWWCIGNVRVFQCDMLLKYSNINGALPYILVPYCYQGGRFENFMPAEYDPIWVLSSSSSS